MAENALGRNQVFAIKNADGTPFHDLVLHKATYDSVVMSLGDKITGDVYYKDNGLNVTMLEYIEYDGVKYILVTPPTIVRNGIVSDNSELKGMTKYSFTFYHPMYQLSNLPFSDVAVTEDSKRYLSENKVFSWIGYPNDFITKIDKNLQGTQWMCVRSEAFPTEKDTMLSEVLSFSNNTIADALKVWYDTWDIPYVIEQVKSGERGYNNGKRFKVIMGLPSSEIYEYQDGHATQNKFVFRMGQGLGLKNNSLTPRNNKIVTRISGCGSEDNIPYGYPQIIWYGEQGREFTYGDSVGTYTNVTIGGHTYPKIVSYPIYKGIVGGMYVELIQHPFTRTNLMPSVYRTTLFNKISFLNPNGTPNTNYNPDITLVDSYDAIPTSQYPYVNAINPDAPSYEYHEFEEVKPELGEESITGVTPINNDLTPASSWDDTMNDDGEYIQSYFKITLPILSFDIYACAAITQEMQINMRSGACLGCTFPVQVDWEAYKESFYDEEGEFSPSGSQRDYEKFPDSSQESISLILQKEFATFGTLMPNVYQNPHAGDLFVVLGISLPESYITNAEERLVSEMKSYMLLNNVHYYDYPLKFDEYFLANNTDILKQIRPNSIVRFKFNNETLQLYVKQLAIKFEEATLPQYDITLTDNIDVVTNPIGRVSDSVDKLATIIALTKQGLKYGGDGKGSDGLSRTHDDTAAGVITFLKGINIGRDFISGILGEGGVFRKEADGKTYLETDSLYVRMKAYFDTVEIKKYEHSSGNRTASNAGFKTVRVIPFGYYQGEFVPLGEDHKYHWTTTEIDQETGQEVIVEHESGVLDTQFYRCYYRATDGEDTVTNDFRVGDLAFVRETNTDAPNQHHLWRVVIGKDNGSNITEDGEGWIDLSNRSSEQFTITTIEDGQSVSHSFRVKGYENGSDAPMAQDDIVQLGNVNNAERQGAIVEYVNGANSPSYQIYQKIGEVDYLDGQTIHDPYVLADKNMIAIGYNSATGKAYMNVYGDAFIGAKDNSTYVKYDSSQKKLTVKAALDVNSTVDGKTLGSYFESLDDVHRVFSSELGNLDANSYPKPPYSQGDIWVNAVYPSSDMTVGGQVIPRGSIHNNEILVCKTNNDEKTRTVVIDGEETLDYELFSIADWKRASEYQHTFDYLTNALKAMQGSTQITGGLVLSSMIALRDTQQTPNIWSGISGMYDNTLATGGVAAWYGGNAIDYEALPTPKPDWSQQRYARSLFRFDGSGYVANGNLSWDNTGRLTIRQVYWGNEDLTNFFNAFSVGTEVVGGATRVVITPKGNMALMNVKENGLVIGGTLTYDANGNVTGVNAGTNGEKYAATRGWVSQNYISIAYFNRIFQAYKSSTITDANKVIPNDVQTTINNLKIMVGAWTEQYLSALGKNDSSGEIVLNEPLASINDAGLASHPSSSGQTIVWNGSAWVYGTAGGSGMTYTFATGDANGQFKVAPSSGEPYNVSIKGLAALAYKASLVVSDIPDLSGMYLPLTGGTMTGNVLHKSSTLQRGVAPDARTVMYRSWIDKDSKNLGWFEFVSETNGDNAIGLYVLSNITSSDNAYGGLQIKKRLGATGNYITVIDANTGELSSRTLKSTVATGTAPLTIASTTLVSNLNADLLDGQHASYFAAAASLATANGKITTLEGYFDNGVANSAKRLSGTSSYTAWGRIYWQDGVPQNVSGHIDLNKEEYVRLNVSGVYQNIFGVASDNTLLVGWGLRNVACNTSIAAGQELNLGYGTNALDSYGKFWAVFRNNGHVTINAADDTDATRNIFLNVGGSTKTNRLYLSNTIYLVVENDGVHVVGGGLYADTYVSALGLSDSGGSAFDETAMWQALGTTISAKDIALAYIQASADTRYALKTDVPTMKTLSWSYGSVTSASGNSYNGSMARSFVIPNATSHLTNDSGFITSSALDSYLPLTGGTINGSLAIRGISHQNFSVSSSAETSGVKWTGVQFQHVVNDTGVMYGGIRMDEQGGSFFRYNSSYTTYKMWDAGNDGTGSGLDADLLDGKHASYFAPLSELNNYVTLATAQTITGVKTFTPQQIFTNGIKIGQYEIVPDAQNGGLHIKGGVYADTYVSALGKSDTGSQVVLNALLESLNNSGLGAHGSSNTTVVWDGSAWTFGTTGLDQTALTNYLSAKILTVKNGTTTLGTWNPTAAGTIDIASAVSGYVTALGTSGDYLTWTKNGTANNLTVPYATHATRLAQSDLANDGDLSQFTHATDLIYAAKGGGNTVTDKPAGVDSFGVLSLKTAVGYYGQILLDAGGALYVRSSNSLSGVAWKKMLDSANTYVASGKGYINGTEITAISGNAATASRLADNTAKTAWGRTYWSSGMPQNVGGNIDLNKGEDIRLKDGSNYYRIFGVSSSDNALLIGWELKSITNSNTTLCAGNNLNIGYGSNVVDTTYGKYWSIFRNNGHFTINADDSSDVFLNVGGATKTTRLYLYKPNAANDTNAVYLEYNTNNAGIHLVGGGLYADTFISALGLSSGGSGGATALSDLVGVSISSASNGQGLAYENGLWKNKTLFTEMSYANNTLSVTVSGVTKSVAIQTGIDGVTSITAGTGLSGGTITSTGTIAINSTYQGYISNGNTAYLWGNHADAGYLTKSAADLLYLPLTGGEFTGYIGVTSPNWQPLTLNSTSSTTTGTWVQFKHNDTAYGGIMMDAVNGSLKRYDTSFTAYTVLDSATSYVSSGKGYLGGNEITTISGNAASATKLQTARTLWGQSFDGSADVSGNMTGVGSITMSGSLNMSRGQYVSFKIGNDYTKALGVYMNTDVLSLGYYTTTEKSFPTYIYGADVRLFYGSNAGLVLDSSGHVGIGTSSPSYKLHVNGEAMVANSIYTNGHLIMHAGSTGIYLNSSGTGIDWHNASNSYVSSLLAFNQTQVIVAASSGLRIGNAVLKYNSSSNALYIEHSSENGAAVNFYTTGGVSALGMSTSASGSINANLLPSTNATYTLGNSSYRWKALYLGYTSGSTTNNYYIEPGGSALNFYGSKDFYFNNGVEINGNLKVENHLGVGTDPAGSSSSYYLYVYSDSSTDTCAYFEGKTSAYTHVNRSDMRLKNFIENLSLGVDAVAEAPSFKYTFKGDSRLMVGTSAQYWRGVLPETVFTEEDNMLSMDYGVTALASVISVARKVMTHEERIAALEAENERLRNEIETLKAA